MTIRRAVLLALLAIPFLAILADAARAAEARPAPCTLVVDLATGKVLVREGACAIRHSPASTFKVALALIGFDAGILESPDAPVWSPPPDAARVREPVDPTKWLALSVVWYSQHLVRELGAARFAAATAALDYGNADVSGDPGADNGLARAWIDSSLEISADEEVAFLSRMLRGELPVSPRAVALVRGTMPRFAAGGWTVSGKTGSAWHRDAAGRPNPADARAWFVGWAERDGRTLVFARFRAGVFQKGHPFALAVRDSLLADLPTLAK